MTVIIWIPNMTMYHNVDRWASCRGRALTASQVPVLPDRRLMVATVMMIWYYHHWAVELVLKGRRWQPPHKARMRFPRAGGSRVAGCIAQVPQTGGSAWAARCGTRAPPRSRPPWTSASAAGSPLGCGLAQSKSLSDKILLIPNSGHCKSLPENFQSDSRIPKLFFQYYASSTRQNIYISHFQIHQ